MVRLTDMPPATRGHLEELECIPYDTAPWVAGPPLDERRVALVSTAGLQRRGDAPFAVGSNDYRVIPGDAPAGDIVMSHISTNYDRSGFQQDLNVVLPLDRLRELAADGVIGAVADYHYSFMGATAPQQMEAKAREMAGLMKADGVNAAVLIPV